MTPPPELPPDLDLLADLVEAVEEGRPPSQAALEEAATLAEGLARVGTVLRRRRAVRRLEQLLASGEYESIRAAAPRVARELGADPETVRWWWSLGGSPPVPSHHQPADDSGERRTTTT